MGATHASGHVDLISAIRVAGSALDKFIEGQILFYKLNQKADIISTGITWAIVQPCGLIMVVSVIGHYDKMTVLPISIARAYACLLGVRRAGIPGREESTPHDLRN